MVQAWRHTVNLNIRPTFPVCFGTYSYGSVFLCFVKKQCFVHILPGLIRWPISSEFLANKTANKLTAWTVLHAVSCRDFQQTIDNPFGCLVVFWMSIISKERNKRWNVKQKFNLLKIGGGLKTNLISKGSYSCVCRFLRA